MIRLSTLEELITHKDFAALIEGYGEECRNKKLKEPNPDYELYGRMEQLGVAKFIMVEWGDRLIGFAVVLFSPVAHYSAMIAVTESIYMVPEYRKSAIGGMLIKFIERLSDEELGADGLFITAPRDSALEKALHKNETYDHTNTVFFKGFR
jgi:hypothetical protein